MGKHNCFMDDELECIKNKAYELWKEDGCKQGLDQKYWIIAEKTVKGLNKKTLSKKVKKCTEMYEAADLMRLRP